jgi:acetyl-CoA acetyltransferase
MAIPKGVTAIAGIGQTEFSKNSGRSELQLAAEAVRSAVIDAGLVPSDVDGLVTFVQDPNDELQLMRSVGMDNVGWLSRTPYGGAGSAAVVQHAAAAVASGAADVVVVYRAFNERSGTRFGQPQSSASMPAMNWYLPFGLDTPAKIFALWFHRYMTTFGLTNEDFGRYTVIARDYAATNPKAWFYERPISLEDHQQSRWIVEPVLRLLDCCQESDGGVALVVTGADRARDLQQPLVSIDAAAQSHLRDGDIMFNYYDGDIARFAQSEHVAEQLWRGSGYSPADIDVAMIYENFSPVVFLQLEALGFVGRGEASDFIKDGQIRIDGQLPVNPHGGLLGEAYIHGVNNILEGVRQLRGTAANQVKDVNRVLISAGQSAAVLSSGGT